MILPFGEFVGEAVIKIGLCDGHEIIKIVFKEVIAAGNAGKLDFTTLLGAGAIDHGAGFFRSANLIIRTMNDNT